MRLESCRNRAISGRFGFETGHEAKKSRLREIGAGKFAGDVALAQNDNATAEVHDLRKFRGNDEKSESLASQLVKQMMDFSFCSDIYAPRDRKSVV